MPPCRKAPYRMMKSTLLRCAGGFVVRDDVSTSRHAGFAPGLESPSSWCSHLLPCPSRAADRVEEQFDQQIRPILEDHCYACHGNGSKKGGVVLDDLGPEQARLRDRDLWWRMLKNVRAGIMPPAGKPAPDDHERRLLEEWIKYGAFGIDPKNPDPGRVTVRRLNRVEYRNTVRELVGVDYDTTSEFPPDDTGYGFDNIGDVLTLSPLLLEKYITAAKAIVSAAVPTSSTTVAEQTIAGRRFRAVGGPAAAGNDDGPLSLSYYEPATVSSPIRVEHAGRYQLVVDLTANERFVDGSFDKNRCRLTFKVDGRERLAREFSRQDGRAYHDVIDQDWQAGEHQLAFELQPLSCRAKNKSVRSRSGSNRSPFGGPWKKSIGSGPSNYRRFFPEGRASGARRSPAVCPRAAGAVRHQGVSAAGGPRNRRSVSGVCRRCFRAGRANLRGRSRARGSNRRGHAWRSTGCASPGTRRSSARPGRR